MAKRVRGSSRPGRRRPAGRRPASPAQPAQGAPQPEAEPVANSAAPTRSGGLTDAEVRRAAELEAAMVAEERAAESTRKRSQERLTAAREASGPRDMNLAQEYAYVSRDLRDIARIAIVMLVILFGLWILIDVAGVFTIT
jgi:hypothetical protein